MAQIDYMKLWLASRNPKPVPTEPSRVPDYSLYEAESAKLEARIEEMRKDPNPPTTLVEGLLYLGMPITVR